MSTPSEYPLKGRVALVTGATGGIGKATCRLLASLGCSVAMHFHSDFKTAGDLVLELDDAYGATGAQFGAVKADMGNYLQVRTLATKGCEVRTYDTDPTTLRGCH
jgi:3-oxoacyl-[acyl-carrier protein] reductase